MKLLNGLDTLAAVVSMKLDVKLKYPKIAILSS